MSLDSFFGTKAPPPLERCANPACNKQLKGVKFELTKGGTTKKYCGECYHKILEPLRPKAEAEV